MKLLKRLRSKSQKRDDALQDVDPASMKVKVKARLAPSGSKRQDFEHRGNLMDRSEDKREQPEEREQVQEDSRDDVNGSPQVNREYTTEKYRSPRKSKKSSSEKKKNKGKHKRSHSVPTSRFEGTCDIRPSDSMSENIKTQPFDFLCGYVEGAFGVSEPEKPQLPAGFERYQIFKEDKSEKAGLSFVSFKDINGVYISMIKDGSKFVDTGIQEGMRVVAINGRKCPEHVGDVLKRIKRVEGILEIVVETKNVFQDKAAEKDDDTLAHSTVARSIRGNYTIETLDTEFHVDDEDSVSTAESSWVSRYPEDDGDMEIMMDIMLGQHEVKEMNDNVMNNFAYIVENMKKGAPLWMFLE